VLQVLQRQILAFIFPHRIRIKPIGKNIKLDIKNEKIPQKIIAKEIGSPMLGIDPIFIISAVISFLQ